MQLSCLCGVCSTDFESAAHAPYSAAVLFEKMKARGFAAVQFAFSSIAESAFTPTGQIEIPAEIPDADIRAVQENARNYGIPVKVINGTFNMAHPDKDIREEGIRRFHVLCRASKQLGAAYISLCSGTRNPDNLWAPHPDNDTDAAWADMLDTVSRCTRTAEQYGIILAVESEASNIISTPERARRLMDTVGSPNLKMILDCANLFHTGQAHPQNVRATLDHAFALYGHDIVLVQREDRSTVIYTKGGERYVTGDSLAETEARLDPAVFFRSHKSYIINLGNISNITPYGRWTYIVRLTGITQDALITHEKYEELEKMFS